MSEKVPLLRGYEALALSARDERKTRFEKKMGELSINPFTPTI